MNNNIRIPSHLSVRELKQTSKMEALRRTNKTQPKALVSAYACNPEGAFQLHPGEDLTGWKLVEQIRLFSDVFLLTHSYNRRGIEAASGQRSPDGFRIVYVELPRWLGWLYRIEFAQRIYYYLWQIKAWRVAKKLHQKVGFDIAHHVTFGNYWIGSFIGAFLPVPFIWGPVGGGQKTPGPLFKEYGTYGVLAELFREFAQWIGLHILYSRRRCLNRAKAMLVCNYETRDNIPERYRNKVIMFPVNGISGEDLSPEPPGQKKNGGFRILTAGRLVRLKGFALALKAFAKIAGEIPDGEFEIIGDGPEEATLKALARNLGIEERVRFSGWKARADVLSRMRESDIFLFPSFRDGGGAVVVEAMASGIPVIALNSGGPGFHVESTWGIKIEPGTPQETAERFASALAEIYRNRGLRETKARAARRRAEEFYLWDKLGERIKAIYAEALKSSGY